MATGKKVSLVLGSGGARGLAHIGVIKWLKENNYEIASISGCSIGSLIGGVYAAGKLDQLETWMCSLTNIDIVSLLDVSWVGSGMFKGDKVINTLVDLIGDIKLKSYQSPLQLLPLILMLKKKFGLIQAHFLTQSEHQYHCHYFLLPLITRASS